MTQRVGVTPARPVRNFSYAGIFTAFNVGAVWFSASKLGRVSMIRKWSMIGSGIGGAFSAAALLSPRVVDGIDGRVQFSQQVDLGTNPLWLGGIAVVVVISQGINIGLGKLFPNTWAPFAVACSSLFMPVTVLPVWAMAARYSLPDPRSTAEAAAAA